ncbi:MAG: ATP-dependent DNA helicase [Alcaligenaceae bacterium]|nr:ATP-dependent DNA helicase [Alcaligenaceae bacterium]
MSFSVSRFFSDDGPFAGSVSTFTKRQAQTELAQAIEDTFSKKNILVAEAGTGTGKTWAYLVPALLEPGKVIISTGTRNLQDQIFKKDVPQVCKTMGIPALVAVLKGRSNYVCHHYLKELEESEAGLRSKEEAPLLQAIRRFTDTSAIGDKADCIAVPETADIWHRVTSTAESCLGQDCQFSEECFTNKARTRAQEADVVVINHALFLADIALRQEGVFDLLPTAEAVVFDEAHQLPDYATRFLGEQISGQKIQDWQRRTLAMVRVQLKGVSKDIEPLILAVGAAQMEFRLQLKPLEDMQNQQALIQNIPNFERVMGRFDELVEAINLLVRALLKHQEAHPDIKAKTREGAAIYDSLIRWSRSHSKADADSSKSGQASAESSDSLEAPSSDDSDSLSSLVAEEMEEEHKQVMEFKDTPYVCWINLTQNAFQLQRAPLNVRHFGKFKRPDQAWVFTSATLSVNGNFDHFVNNLGLYDAEERVWESPFHYQDNTIMLIPKLPLPDDFSFRDKFLDVLMPLIKATHGGVLILCTSLRAVDEFAEMLLERLDQGDIDRAVLKQGENSRGYLMDKFRQERNAILVGSASFWEGVDFPGDLLTLVAIDKIPFMSPDDPVIDARIKDCESRGGSSFFEIQIPHAAISLKQGAGRLIRSETDAGVLVIGDVRLVEKGYGKRLWQGLPDFYRTREPADALQFLTYLANLPK